MDAAKLNFLFVSDTILRNYCQKVKWNIFPIQDFIFTDNQIFIQIWSMYVFWKAVLPANWRYLKWSASDGIANAAFLVAKTFKIKDQLEQYYLLGEALDKLFYSIYFQFHFINHSNFKFVI